MNATKTFLMVFGVAIGIAIQVTPCIAQTGNQIEITKKFLGSHKYTHGDDTRRPVYKSFGGYQDQFKDLLADVPAALEEANRAKPGATLQLIGNLTIVAGAAMLLNDAINDAEAVSNEDLSGVSSDNTPIYVALVGAGISAIGGVIKGRHLRESVRIYNEHQGRIAEHSHTPGFQLSVQPELVSNRPGLSIRLR